MTTTDDQKPKDNTEADSSAGVSCAAASGSAVDVRQTIITAAGVLRCCLATVACDHLDAGRKVSEGDKSACQHCKRLFTLRKPLRGKMVWYPDDFEFNPASC